jgi:hypothetical protein
MINERDAQQQVRIPPTRIAAHQSLSRPPIGPDLAVTINGPFGFVTVEVTNLGEVNATDILLITATRPRSGTCKTHHRTRPTPAEPSP